MAGNALGIAFSLQLLVSIIQGRRDVDLFHHPTLEAVAGQNVAFPCTLKSLFPNLSIASIEWKKDDAKLVVYHPVYGKHLFWPNVTFQTEMNDEERLLGSHLHLTGVTEWDSGIYTCEITCFPLGSIKGETTLTVTDDIKLQCDENGTVEVHYGGNATICCRANANAQYRWTKDEQPVSETESLELWQVTDAHAGVYKLTVNTGNKSLHKDFIITVLTVTTSPNTDAATVSPQGLPESARSSLPTSPTTGLSAHSNWTTHPSVSNLTLTAVERITSSTNSAAMSSSPASSSTHPETNRELNSTAFTNDITAFTWAQEKAGDETMNTSTLQPNVDGRESGTPGRDFKSSEHPELPTGTVTVLSPEDRDARRGHVLMVLIIIPVLLLIAAVGFFFKRQIMKKRMDLPPPFKPPPPPIKYVAAKRSETTTHLFPVSRCNSVADPTETRQMLV